MVLKHFLVIDDHSKLPWV